MKLEYVMLNKIGQGKTNTTFVLSHLCVEYKIVKLIEAE